MTITLPCPLGCAHAHMHRLMHLRRPTGPFACGTSGSGWSDQDQSTDSPAQVTCPGCWATFNGSTGVEVGSLYEAERLRGLAVAAGLPVPPFVQRIGLSFVVLHPERAKADMWDVLDAHEVNARTDAVEVRSGLTTFVPPADAPINVEDVLYPDPTERPSFRYDDGSFGVSLYPPRGGDSTWAASWTNGYATGSSPREALVAALANHPDRKAAHDAQSALLTRKTEHTFRGTISPATIEAAWDEAIRRDGVIDQFDEAWTASLTDDSEFESQQLARRRAVELAAGFSEWALVETLAHNTPGRNKLRAIRTGHADR